MSNGIVPRFRPLILLRVEAGGSPTAWPIGVAVPWAIVVVLIGAAIFFMRRRSPQPTRQASKTLD